MQMKIFKQREKENFVDKHHQKTDMFTRICNIIRGTTENNSLKRRSEEPPDFARITKYRRVTDDFPKYITKPFEDDVRFIHPVMSNNKRSASDKKSTLNKPSTLFNNIHQQPIKQPSNRYCTNFADLEYSDDDDDIEQQIYSTRPLASSSFNTNEYMKSNTINNQNNKLNTLPNVVHIPINLLGSKKPLPQLIETRTGNILGTNPVPNLKPIYNQQHNINNGFNSINNGYTYINNNIGNTINKIDQQKQLHQLSNNITTRSTASAALPIQWSHFNKQHNAKNLAHNSHLIGNTNSVVSQVYNVKQRNSYADLLKKVAPDVYISRLLSSTSSSSATDIKPNSRQSIHHNRISGGNGIGQKLNNDNIIDQIDLTFNERNKNDDKFKSNNIINLDDDLDDLNIIDLDDEEIQIIRAYNKMNRRELKEEKKLQEIDKQKLLPIVEPINSLKEKNILSPLYDSQWLERFNLKCEEKTRIRNQKITEATEDNLYSKNNNRAKTQTEETERQERIIQKKFKNFIISSETIVLDDSEEEEEIEFPEFSENDDEIIKKSIYRGSSDEILITKFNMNITRRDIQTLIGDNWLNDEVINFYMNLLMERGEKRYSEGYPKVYAMNTFFIPRLMSSGHSGVRRWTRKVDIFDYDIIPVPVHVGGVHWCMAIIHLKNKTIKYYDSMGTPNIRILNALEQYLKDESLDKKKCEYDTTDFLKEFVPDCPRQMNGSDCGVFSCMFAEYISRDRNITFSQQHMHYFRHKMVLEIVNGKLML